MAFANSYFSGSIVNCRIPCTSSEGRLCDIFGDLSTWNKFFWKVDLELKELSPGKLSLVESHGADSSWETWDEWRLAATLLHHLLTLHRCVVSVDLNKYMYCGHPQLVCDALRKSPGLKNLNLRLESLHVMNVVIMDIPTEASFTAALPHLKHLEELDCGSVLLPRAVIEVLSEFLARTQSLTTLIMNGVKLSCESAVVILKGLKLNATISTLSINSTLMSPFTSQCGVMFADYLNDTRTLRTLTVNCLGVDDCREVPRMIGWLLCNRTLSELNVIGFDFSDNDVDILARHLCQNRNLRRFKLVFPSYLDCGYVWNRPVGPWLAVVAENKTLEELTLNVSWNADDSRSLFSTLASNASLKITVTQVRDNECIEICRALRESGAQERFSVGTQGIGEYNVLALTDCRELSRISFNAVETYTFNLLDIFLRLLPSCSHVTSLCLAVGARLLTSTVLALTARYILHTKVLRELKLFFQGCGTWRLIHASRRELAQALCVNESINRLSIDDVYVDEIEARMLADSLRTSRALVDVSFFSTYKCTSRLIRNLSPNFSTNYTLLGMHHVKIERHEFGRFGDDLFTVQSVVCRNWSLVTRAAHFVVGTRRRYCAAAAELVHSSQGLVEKVRELASVDENEALSRINASMKSYNELDDFMRLAGVVKYSVTCPRRVGGQTQLVDLNKDCWLYVRQFLKMGHILDCE